MLVAVLGILAVPASANAAINFESVESDQNGGGSGGNTTIEIDAPAGIEEGDFLIAGIAYDGGNNETITPPAGWVEIEDENKGNQVGVVAYYKIAGDSEPGSYTWGISSSEAAAGGILRYSGVDTDDPIHAWESDDGKSNNSHFDEVTTTIDDTVVVMFGAIDSSKNYSTPAGLTERFDTKHGNGGPGSVCFELEWPDAGETDDYSSNHGINDDWATMTIALTPAAEGPPVGADAGNYQRPSGVLDLPNGGEELHGGDSYMIFWGASGTDAQGVNLLLSTDGGSTYPTTIAAGLSVGNGYYNWTVPVDVDTTEARVRLEVTDGPGSVLLSDESDSNFTIIPPEEPQEPGEQFDPQGVGAGVLSIDDNQNIPTEDGVWHCTPGMLMIGSAETVYYCGRDLKRYMFPNRKTYESWYGDDFSRVVEMPDEDIEKIPAGGIVTYKPGSRMLTHPNIDEVYVVGENSVLHLVPSEAVAFMLYGPSWKTYVDDIPPQFFVLYTIGEPLNDDGTLSAEVSLESGDTLWSVVEKTADDLGVDADVGELARAVAERNNLSVPEWGITGWQNARSLSTGSRLDLGPVFEALQNR